MSSEPFAQANCEFLFVSVYRAVTESGIVVMIC